MGKPSDSPRASLGSGRDSGSALAHSGLFLWTLSAPALTPGQPWWWRPSPWRNCPLPTGKASSDLWNTCSISSAELCKDSARQRASRGQQSFWRSSEATRPGTVVPPDQVYSRSICTDLLCGSKADPSPRSWEEHVGRRNWSEQALCPPASHGVRYQRARLCTVPVSTDLVLLRTGPPTPPSLTVPTYTHEAGDWPRGCPDEPQ